MLYDVVADMMNKIANMAAKRQQPLIILENPKYELATVYERVAGVDQYIANIGNASVSFEGFYPSEMIEVYAQLKSQLEAEDAILASRSAENAKST